MFVISKQHAKWGKKLKSPATILNNFRKAIRKRFKHTHIKRQGQAVTVNFKNTNVSLDIIPAIQHDKRLRIAKAYLIPGRNGKWIKAVPKVEHTRFEKANKKSGNKLAKTIQLLKCWKYCRRSRQVPL